MVVEQELHGTVDVGVRDGQNRVLIGGRSNKNETVLLGAILRKNQDLRSSRAVEQESSRAGAIARTAGLCC